MQPNPPNQLYQPFEPSNAGGVNQMDNSQIVLTQNGQQNQQSLYGDQHHWKGNELQQAAPSQTNCTLVITYLVCALSFLFIFIVSLLCLLKANDLLESNFISSYVFPNGLKFGANFIMLELPITIISILQCSMLIYFATSNNGRDISCSHYFALTTSFVIFIFGIFGFVQFGEILVECPYESTACDLNRLHYLFYYSIFPCSIIPLLLLIINTVIIRNLKGQLTLTRTVNQQDLYELDDIKEDQLPVQNRPIKQAPPIQNNRIVGCSTAAPTATAMAYKNGMASEHQVYNYNQKNPQKNQGGGYQMMAEAENTQKKPVEGGVHDLTLGGGNMSPSEGIGNQPSYNGNRSININSFDNKQSPQQRPQQNEEGNGQRNPLGQSCYMVPSSQVGEYLNISTQNSQYIKTPIKSYQRKEVSPIDKLKAEAASSQFAQKKGIPESAQSPVMQYNPFSGDRKDAEISLKNHPYLMDSSDPQFIEICKKVRQMVDMQVKQRIENLNQSSFRNSQVK